jgi:di/tricarboxylate transporter
VSVDAWLTLAVLVVTLAVLAGERLPASLVAVGAVTILLLAGVIEEEQALAGFSNPAPIAVAALYVLAAAVHSTRVLERLVDRLLADRGAEARGGALRMLAPAAGFSAFLNNTPIVAMTAPAVAGWARRAGHPASAYLMPVCFAISLGGVVTLVGTSTNLVVSGLLEEAGREPLGLFEQARAGLPVAALGIVLLAFLAPRLLPARRTPGEALGDEREFTVEMVVDEGPLAGKSVAEVGLRNLEGVFLVEIERDGRPLAPVGPEHVLVAGDRLTFAGNVERVLDLQRRPGLHSAEHRHFSLAAPAPGRRLYEVVVAEASPLAGSTLKETGFRARYGAAVVAIHRAGERVPGKLGDVTVRPGDVLLVLAGPDFNDRWRGRRDFLVVAPGGSDGPPRLEKAPIVALIVLGLLGAVGSGLLEIVPAALLAALAVVGLRVLTPAEAREAVDLNVVVLVAASFGLAAAMTASGLAGEIASTLIEPFSVLGDVGVLTGVLAGTVVLTQLVTNNAAAAVMFPVALAAAGQADVDVRPLAVAVALGASYAFLTPIGYQTNTMVYGMGGYRFGDFARLGMPLLLALFVLTLVLVPLGWTL